jgi:hypothetical protein
LLVRVNWTGGTLEENPYYCSDLALLNFSLLLSWTNSLDGLQPLFFFLYLLLLREAGIGGLELSPSEVTLVIFFWETGELIDSLSLFLDYGFFFDFDFLLRDFPKLFPLLSFRSF